MVVLAIVWVISIPLSVFILYYWFENCTNFPLSLPFFRSFVAYLSNELLLVSAKTNAPTDWYKSLSIHWWWRINGMHTHTELVQSISLKGKGSHWQADRFPHNVINGLQPGALLTRLPHLIYCICSQTRWPKKEALKPVAVCILCSPPL